MAQRSLKISLSVDTSQVRAVRVSIQVQRVFYNMLIAIFIGAFCATAALGAPQQYHNPYHHALPNFGGVPVNSPIELNPIVGVHSPIGFNDDVHQPQTVPAVSPVLINFDSHNLRRRRDVVVPTVNGSQPEFHTSHRIPEHIAAAVARQHSEEEQFQTSHQIPSHEKLPRMVALHPKGEGAVVQIIDHAQTNVSATAAGHRHRREADDSVADAEPAVHVHEHVGGLKFPVPVDQIVKHSQAAPEIHHHSHDATKSSKDEGTPLKHPNIPHHANTSSSTTESSTTQ